MINQKSNNVIVHMTFDPVCVRFAGVERKVMDASNRGFCWVEFDDGDTHPISHPLEEWFLGLINRTAGVGNVYFVIDPPGQRSQEGQGTSDTDVNNIQIGMNG